LVLYVTASAPQQSPLKLISSRAATDAELCRDFLNGNAQAFGELVRRHQDLVLRLVRRYSRDNDGALELAQKAYLQAFEAARRALPRLSAAANAEGEVPFKAWLIRIAINLGKNHLRDARRWHNVPVEAIDSERRLEATADKALERAQIEAFTRDAVVELPRRQREVFTLRVDGGLPFAEVAVGPRHHRGQRQEPFSLRSEAPAAAGARAHGKRSRVMTCDEVELLLVTGEALTAEAKEHLGTCEKCSEFQRDAVQVIQDAALPPLSVLEKGALQGLAPRVHHAWKQKERRGSAVRRFMGLAVAACMGAAVASSVLVSRLPKQASITHQAISSDEGTEWPVTGFELPASAPDDELDFEVAWPTSDTN
jgi:RNA polymerase sigma-70 factor (ECF subfamily)